MCWNWNQQTVPPTRGATSMRSVFWMRPLQKGAAACTLTEIPVKPPKSRFPTPCSVRSTCEFFLSTLHRFLSILQKHKSSWFVSSTRSLIISRWVVVNRPRREARSPQCHWAKCLQSRRSVSLSASRAPLLRIPISSWIPSAPSGNLTSSHLESRQQICCAGTMLLYKASWRIWQSCFWKMEIMVMCIGGVRGTGIRLGCSTLMTLTSKKDVFLVESTCDYEILIVGSDADED